MADIQLQGVEIPVDELIEASNNMALIWDAQEKSSKASTPKKGVLSVIKAKIGSGSVGMNVRMQAKIREQLLANGGLPPNIGYSALSAGNDLKNISGYASSLGIGIGSLAPLVAVLTSGIRTQSAAWDDLLMSAGNCICGHCLATIKFIMNRNGQNLWAPGLVHKFQGNQSEKEKDQIVAAILAGGLIPCPLAIAILALLSGGLFKESSGLENSSLENSGIIATIAILALIKIEDPNGYKTAIETVKKQIK